MSRFKIGDRVRVVRIAGSKPQSCVGMEFTITEDEKFNGGEQSWSGKNNSPWAFRESELELVTPSIPSPIVTETVTRVKPGVYGIVFISDNGDIRVVTSKSPDELRAAADTFRALADHFENPTKENTNGR